MTDEECIYCAAGVRRHTGKGAGPGGAWHTLRVRCSGPPREFLELRMTALRTELAYLERLAKRRVK